MGSKVCPDLRMLCPLSVFAGFCCHAETPAAFVAATRAHVELYSSLDVVLPWSSVFV